MTEYRTGVLIDSFDPVCVGHMDLCASAVRTLKLDRVFLILKDSDNTGSVSDYDDRWKMLVTACSISKSYHPIDCIKNSTFSLSKEYPRDKFHMIRVPDRLPRILCPSVHEYCNALGLYGLQPRVRDARNRIDKLFGALHPHRFAHSLSVAATSRQLALRFGADPKAAEEAGLLHDCAKCLPLPQMQRIAVDHHLTDDPHVLESGALLHSLVGAFIACSEYGVTDQEELSAIRYHNTGFAGMSRLAMCVCLGDYIEPNREWFPSLEETRRLSEISLEKGLLLSLTNTLDHVRSKGKYVHPWTSETVAWLKSLE